MSRQLRYRKTDRGTGSPTSDVLLRLCHEPFQSKLTKALPFISLLVAALISGKGGGVMRSSEA